MSHFPASITQINHVAPVPRRIRGVRAGETLVDTTRALYVWESPNYPQYYFPAGDVRIDSLSSDGTRISTAQGDAQEYVLRNAAGTRPVGRLIVASQIAGLVNTVRIDWDACDRWFEEDEEVFVHPRSPYTRVDASLS